MSHRRIGLLASNSAFSAAAFSGASFSNLPVSIEPGLIALTRIPLGSSSLLSVRAIDRSAALLAEYTLSASRPVWFAIDVVSTTLLPSVSSGANFCTVKKGPLVLIAKTSSKVCSVTAKNGSKLPIPALTTKASTVPKSLRTRSASASIAASECASLRTATPRSPNWRAASSSVS